MEKTPRYPSYNVMQKENSLSWNAATRRAISDRLNVSSSPSFLSRPAFDILSAIAQRLIPQERGTACVPIAALIDQKLTLNQTSGQRHIALPHFRDAWRIALDAFEAEAQFYDRTPFVILYAAEQDFLIKKAEAGELSSSQWRGMNCALFCTHHLIPEIVSAYFSHPISWNAIGYGGPASSRGYVRLGLNERDPWEASEATEVNQDKAREQNARIR